jgi:hypothetical protein
MHSYKGMNLFWGDMFAHFTVHGCTYYCASRVHNFLYQVYPFDLPFPLYYITYYHITHFTKPFTRKRLTNG